MEQTQARANWYDDWWRWPLVPLAAVAGLFAAWLVAFVVLWLQVKFVGGFEEDGWYYQFIMPALASAAAGWGFGTGACFTAPRGQKIAGTVMVTILGLFSIASTAIAWKLPSYTTGQSIQTTVAVIITFTAAVLGVVHFEN